MVGGILTRSTSRPTENLEIYIFRLQSIEIWEFTKKISRDFLFNRIKVKVLHQCFPWPTNRPTDEYEGFIGKFTFPIYEIIWLVCGLHRQLGEDYESDDSAGEWKGRHQLGWFLAHKVYGRSIFFTYRVFIEYCVFQLNVMIFLNSASSAAA